MTIISAAITKRFFVVATDSQITYKASPNKYNNGKFVCFQTHKCVASYWGMTEVLSKNKVIWEVHPWLKSYVQKQNQFKSLEDFAKGLAKDLTSRLSPLNWTGENRKIGIHLVGFELFRGLSIPELYLIIGDSNGNWKFNCERRTYCDLTNGQTTNKPLEAQRLEYNQFLSQNFHVYNNGDNQLFVNFLDAYKTAISTAQSRHDLMGDLPKAFYRDLIEKPIKQIVEIQKKYYRDNKKVVGGRTYAVCMNFDGSINFK